MQIEPCVTSLLEELDLVPKHNLKAFGNKNRQDANNFEGMPLRRLPVITKVHAFPVLITYPTTFEQSKIQQ